MRVLLQRVSSASVRIDDKVHGEIAAGLLLFIGLGSSDTAVKLDAIIEKILQLRIFADERGRFQHSLLELKAGALIVSQFTLYGSTNNGRRPDFAEALNSDQAKALYTEFVHRFTERSPGKVAQGVFGATMQVSLVNDGPVTLLIEL